MFTHQYKIMLNNSWKSRTNKNIPLFVFDSLQLHFYEKWEPP